MKPTQSATTIIRQCRKKKRTAQITSFLSRRPIVVKGSYFKIVLLLHSWPGSKTPDRQSNTCWIRISRRGNIDRHWSEPALQRLDWISDQLLVNEDCTLRFGISFTAGNYISDALSQPLIRLFSSPGWAMNFLTDVLRMDGNFQRKCWKCICIF